MTVHDQQMMAVGAAITMVTRALIDVICIVIHQRREAKRMKALRAAWLAEYGHVPAPFELVSDDDQ